jgi:uncharacterized protein
MNRLGHRVLYGPTGLRAGWRLCMFLGLVVLLLDGSRRLYAPAGPQNNLAWAVREAFDFLILVLAAWTMSVIEGRTLAQYGLSWCRQLPRQLAHGVLLGFLGISALVGAIWLSGGLQVAAAGLTGPDALRWAVTYACLFATVALKEEFLARGYVLFALGTGIGFWPAALLSSVVFAFGHHANGSEDWLGLLNAGLFGLLACFLVRRTGSLWMPIGLHLSFDWGESYLYGAINSGSAVLPGRLLTTDPSGPVWLSGGLTGPEGSVVCSAVIALMWVASVVWPGYQAQGGRQASAEVRDGHGENAQGAHIPQQPGAQQP